MAIVRMTSKEIEQSTTQEMWKQFKVACEREPDMTDPDAPDVDELTPLTHLGGRKVLA